MLQKPEDIRQERFLEEVRKLNLRFPGKEIVSKTGYNSGVVSEYLNSRKVVSERFLRAFCQAFGVNFTETFVERPSLPGDPLNRERAMLKVLWNRFAKREAEHLGVPIDMILDDMDRDTMIAWRDLERLKQDEGEKEGK